LIRNNGHDTPYEHEAPASGFPGIKRTTHWHFVLVFKSEKGALLKTKKRNFKNEKAQNPIVFNELFENVRGDH